MMAGAQQYQPAPVSSTFDPEAFIYEQLGFIGLHAGMAQSYLEAGDAPGFNYSMASMTARVRSVVSLMNPDQDAATAKELGN